MPRAREAARFRRLPLPQSPAFGEQVLSRLRSSSASHTVPCPPPRTPGMCGTDTPALGGDGRGGQAAGGDAAPACAFTAGDVTARCHYCTHYSSAIIVASYLVRMPPFTQAFCSLQVSAPDPLHARAHAHTRTHTHAHTHTCTHTHAHTHTQTHRARSCRLRARLGRGRDPPARNPALSL